MGAAGSIPQPRRLRKAEARLHSNAGNAWHGLALHRIASHRIALAPMCGTAAMRKFACVRVHAVWPGHARIVGHNRNSFA
jgi:hypothetical protein